MSEEREPGRLSLQWSVDARDDLRGIDRATALELLHCIDRFLMTRGGDIKRLKPPLSGLRLRCGDYRVFFDQAGESGIAITRVRHRRDAYR